MKNSLQAILTDGIVNAHSNKIEIKEADEKATVKKCAFVLCDVELVEITRLPMALDGPFKPVKDIGLRKNCDGVFFVNNKEGEYILCLVELKSTLSPLSLQTAKKQLDVSYSKTMLFLQAINCFHPEAWKVRCFVVGAINSDKLTQLSKKYQCDRSSVCEEEQFFLHACTSVATESTTSFNTLEQLPLNDALKLRILPVCIPVDQESEEIAVDLKTYL